MENIINNEIDYGKFFFCVGEDKNGNLHMSCSDDKEKCADVFDDRGHCPPMDINEVCVAVLQMVNDFKVLDEFLDIIECIKRNESFDVIGYSGEDDADE